MIKNSPNKQKPQYGKEKKPLSRFQPATGVVIKRKPIKSEKVALKDEQ